MVFATLIDPEARPLTCCEFRFSAICACPPCTSVFCDGPVTFCSTTRLYFGAVPAYFGFFTNTTLLVALYEDSWYGPEPADLPFRYDSAPSSLPVVPPFFSSVFESRTPSDGFGRM